MSLPNLKYANPYVLMLIVSLIWGMAGPVISHTLLFITPLVFLTYRFAISATIGILFFWRYPERIPRTRIEYEFIMLHSLFIIVFGLGLLFFGFAYTDSLTGTVLAALGPLFTVIAGYALLKEKVTRQEMLGILFAIVGSILIVVTDESTRPQALPLLGAALIIISRVTDAIGGVATKYALAHGTHPQAITHSSFIIGFICVGLVTFIKYSPQTFFLSLQLAPLSAHLGVLYMALLSGTLAYVFAATALTKLPLGHVSIFTYITPLWALPLAIFWLGEGISWFFILGGIIISLGVYLAEHQNAKKRHRSPSTTHRHV